jgi:predicted AAA+ superfamily ATPase
LTWRAIVHHLYPLSLEEIYWQIPLTRITLEQKMIYGAYPNVVQPEWQPWQEYLASLFNNYLYKDILSFEGIKKHGLIVKLIQALALQIGNEFSYTELANTLWSNKDTIAKYILILEQAFIIKTLSPLFSNQRREIKAHKKVYFWDLWVRNAAINNFNPLVLRNDVWQLRENLCFIERTKYISYHNIDHKQYFRRETAGSEIDYIEQHWDQYDCREFKYSPKKWGSLPSAFDKRYPNNTFDVIRTDTIWTFVR